ncbi:MAG: RNA-splicing factor [Vezdaea aestivalis]|nr:MAG: RNA-splicing factor [Vezdaea aestivalis]
MFKKRSNRSANIRKRASPQPEPSSSSSSGSENDEVGVKVKRRKIVGRVQAGSDRSKLAERDALLAVTTFDGDRSRHITENDEATKQSNWYEKNNDMSPENLLGTRRPTTVEKDGLYKGAAGYQSFVQKNLDAPSRSVGPIKAPTNIRTITVTDFAPDVCKDYKQTGFCGFGDSCKFLHAREDYKQGWELDRDWEVGTKGKKLTGKTVASADRRTGGNAGEAEDEDEDESLLEKIPFACVICKKPYNNPIVTKCGHYFCEACALKRYRKTPNCVACGSGTGGVFNGAKNLKRLLEKKRERARIRREKAKEAGEEVSSDEEDEGGAEGD